MSGKEQTSQIVSNLFTILQILKGITVKDVDICKKIFELQRINVFTDTGLLFILCLLQVTWLNGIGSAS